MDRRLAEEMDRTAHYLSSFTHLPLQSLLINELLSPHLQTILNMPGSGLASMLDADRISDLRRLYTLFLRVPDDLGKTALRLALRSDIEERGRLVNEASEQGPSSAVLVNDGEGMDEDDPKGKGKAIVKVSATGAALSAAIRWVQEVLDLKDKFDAVLQQAFNGDMAVQSSINEVRSISSCQLSCRLMPRPFNPSSMLILARPSSYPYTSTSI